MSYNVNWRRVRVDERCEHCQGFGVTISLAWQEWWNARRETFPGRVVPRSDPMGAAWEAENPPPAEPEEEPCRDCEGTGRVASWVSLYALAREVAKIIEGGVR